MKLGHLFLHDESSLQCLVEALCADLQMFQAEGVGPLELLHSRKSGKGPVTFSFGAQPLRLLPLAGLLSL